MSLSKGNIRRNRPQKHQNRTAFKNDLHDTSKKTKILNSMQVSGVCIRCREIIEWKIKYKKYKPLTAPKKCVGCDEKAVKHAYHIYCSKCASDKHVCAKCCKPIDIANSEGDEPEPNDTELQGLLKTLPERKRRTVLRYIKKQDGEQTKSDIEKIVADMSTFDLDDSSFDGFSSDEDSEYEEP
ncbi:uncharacterized protein C9orf85 homolog [Colias croceus]|uniref:uncharacterized protein C9orf85 homolog n=1 Tax=Colias crocea TaxID=72248 RepID=UPI001E280EEB|nr:uncharacterized protein C9orf85 homolog [Colias croceus]